jgi:hypothetical protein
MTTVVLTVVGALYRELILNIKPDVQTTKATLFGVADDSTDDGLVEDVADVDSKLQENAIERREEHEQVDDQLEQLRSRVDSVISALQRNDDIEIHIQHGENNDQE